MLRSLYRTVLRLHPPFFRQRFADEMLSIFDSAQSRTVALALLIDALTSLARQWSLRPHFWEEAAMRATANGAPLFYSAGSSMPRTAALASGALMSALVLQGVCWTVGYAWNHPRYMNIRPGYGPHGRVPEKFLHEQPVNLPPRPAEPSLITDQGRVLLIFNSHKPPVTPTQVPGKDSERSKTTSSLPISSATAVPSAPIIGLSLVSEELQAYTGSYVGTDPDRVQVKVTMDNSRLQLEVVGQFRSQLLLLSNPQLMGCEIADCWVHFGAREDGSFDRLEIHNGGREIVAYRVQSGMVF